MPDDRRPRLEDLARLGVDREVEVALAVAALDVLQAVPLLGQRTEALGEERQARAPSPTARPSASGRPRPRRRSSRRGRARRRARRPSSPTASRRTYTWSRARPSERSRNPAFPAVRRARTRPAVATAGLPASSSSPEAASNRARISETVAAIAEAQRRGGDAELLDPLAGSPAGCGAGRSRSACFGRRGRSRPDRSSGGVYGHGPPRTAVRPATLAERRYGRGSRRSDLRRVLHQPEVRRGPQQPEARAASRSGSPPTTTPPRPRR